MQKLIVGNNGNSYTYDTNNGKYTNEQTGREVEKIWVYPVKRSVWGGVPETVYFRTAAERTCYIKSHDRCESMPRCKVFSDELD